jgi:hypothetical protein
MHIRFSRLLGVVLLSLILGLSAALSAAHSHDGHKAEQCNFSVVQSGSLIVAADCQSEYIASDNLAPTLFNIDATVFAPRVIFYARAPPFNL